MNSTGRQDGPAGLQRPWYQFTLRGLLLVTFLLAVTLASAVRELQWAADRRDIIEHTERHFRYSLAGYDAGARIGQRQVYEASVAIRDAECHGPWPDRIGAGHRHLTRLREFNARMRHQMRHVNYQPPEEWVIAEIDEYETEAANWLKNHGDQSVPTIEYVVPIGYQGIIAIEEDTASGVPVRQEGSCSVYVIPESGRLVSQDMAPLDQWHVVRVRYADGTCVPKSGKPGALGLREGLAERSPGGRVYLVLGTFADFKKLWWRQREIEEGLQKHGWDFAKQLWKQLPAPEEE